MLETEGIQTVGREGFFAKYTEEETSPTELKKASLRSFVDKVVAFVETSVSETVTLLSCSSV